jgi:NAD(P)-dependent dehydrogenase (short-subunit alcohol dehydrogenase family)
MADFRHAPMIEGEFALRLGHDLPPCEQAYSAAEVRDAVTDVVMAIDGEATFIGCDVADEAAVAAAVNKAAATYGAINILFNNAGGGSMENFPNESSEEFSRIVRVNLVGTFNMSQAVWSHLIEAGGEL